MADRPRLCIDLRPSLPPKVQAALLEVLANVSPSQLSDQRVAAVRQALRDGQSPRYETDWAAFSYLYFAANLAKAHLAVRRLQWSELQSPLRILDLGTGGGASLLGALSALEATHPNGSAPIDRIVVVDSNARQLELFDKVTRPHLAQRYPKIAVEAHHRDAIEFLGASPRNDNLVVAAYLLSELQPEETERLRAKLLDMQRRFPCMIAFVESDPLKRGITVDRLDRPPELLSYDEVTLDLSFLDKLRLTEKPKFYRRTRFSSFIPDYFAAWETHDFEIIGRIFASDAEYSVNGRSILRGLGEILDYWKVNATKQRRVRCQIFWSVELDDGVVAEWGAEFDQILSREHRSLRGILRLTVENGKIVRFTEVYDQTIRRLDFKDHLETTGQ